jgi:hypothetical protein
MVILNSLFGKNRKESASHIYGEIFAIGNWPPHQQQQQQQQQLQASTNLLTQVEGQRSEESLVASYS